MCILFQTYIAEIAQPQHRGWLGGLTSPILAFGALLSYCLGSLISWHYVAIIGIFIPLSMIPGLFLLPDTPYWYIQQHYEKNLPKTSDQLIFCKYTLVFSKCSQIY